MPAPLSTDQLLDLPVAEAVRLRALELLAAAQAARPRLEATAPGNEDDEALHDFRVALRRLRSVLKAHANLPGLGGKVERLRRRLGDVADATGPARDAEVQLAWLTGARRGLPATARAAHAWLRARLVAGHDAAYAKVRDEAARRFDALHDKAQRRLARYRADVTDKGVTWAAALATLLLEHAADLAAQLAAVRRATDEEAAHRARITGKQLRYLVEPLAASERVGAAAKTVVADLKQLQDVLGELHDAHVLGHVAQQAMVDAAAERARQLGQAVFAGGRTRRPPDLRAGLVAIASRARAHRDKLYRDLAARRRGIDRLLEDVRALAAALGGPPPDVEIERKYLLRGMPEVGAAEAVEMEQGYIPGKRLVERLRRWRGADGVEHLVRSMKLGSGVRRIEVEEEIDRDLWDRLWPLTEGRRLAKTRYLAPDGDRVWEIDRFHGRDLHLAEIELPHEGVEVVPPPWLKGLIEREVTGEKAYTNEFLAISNGGGEARPPRRRHRKDAK
jgi:CHAD domain-containing protein/CYTH domain-containing protein